MAGKEEDLIYVEITPGDPQTPHFPTVDMADGKTQATARAAEQAPEFLAAVKHYNEAAVALYRGRINLPRLPEGTFGHSELRWADGVTMDSDITHLGMAIPVQKALTQAYSNNLDDRTGGLNLEVFFQTAHSDSGSYMRGINPWDSSGRLGQPIAFNTPETFHRLAGAIEAAAVKMDDNVKIFKAQLGDNPTSEQLAHARGLVEAAGRKELEKLLKGLAHSVEPPKSVNHTEVESPVLPKVVQNVFTARGQGF